MPTEPLAGLLDRDLARVAAADLTKITRPLLRELVDHGTNVFQRCQVSATGGEDEDVAAPVLYLHMLQMTDGIEVQLFEGCAGAAIPNLRSSFEGLLGLAYILESDENYAQRSLAWFAGVLLNKLADRERIEEGNPKSKAADKELPGTLKKVAPLVKGDIQRWNAILDEPRMRPIADEVRKAKKWHGAFGGPRSLEDLARRLDMEMDYQLLYRRWSSVVHAGDLMRFLIRSKDGNHFNPLRDSQELKEVAHTAAVYLLRATRFMIHKYRAGENLTPWYLREIRPLLVELNPALKNFSLA